ncbi:MAG: hypothetical protein ACREVN_08610 [Gammaproteobacteria bacterium]
MDAPLEWTHLGAYYLDAENRHRYPGHDLLNLPAAYRLSPRWQVAARLTNLTDRAYADRADFAFGEFRYFPGRDRPLSRVGLVRRTVDRPVAPAMCLLVAPAKAGVQRSCPTGFRPGFRRGDVA